MEFLNKEQIKGFVRKGNCVDYNATGFFMFLGRKKKNQNHTKEEILLAYKNYLKNYYQKNLRPERKEYGSPVRCKTHSFSHMNGRTEVILRGSTFYLEMKKLKVPIHVYEETFWKDGTKAGQQIRLRSSVDVEIDKEYLLCKYRYNSVGIKIFEDIKDTSAVKPVMKITMQYNLKEYTVLYSESSYNWHINSDSEIVKDIIKGHFRDKNDVIYGFSDHYLNKEKTMILEKVYPLNENSSHNFYREIPLIKALTFRDKELFAKKTNILNIIPNYLTLNEETTLDYLSKRIINYKIN